MVEMNSRKAAIVGCEFVGSASAFALMESGLFSELVLIDADRNRAEGEALDIGHGLPFSKPMQIYAGGYEDISDAAVVIVTAGAGQKPGETRLDLVKKNVAIFKSIIPQIAKYNQSGIKKPMSPDDQYQDLHHYFGYLHFQYCQELILLF